MVAEAVEQIAGLALPAAAPAFRPLCRRGRILGVARLDDLLVALVRTPENQSFSGVDRENRNLDEISRQAIQSALENARGNLSAAARQLGISRQTLYRKLKPCD